MHARFTYRWLFLTLTLALAFLVPTGTLDAQGKRPQPKAPEFSATDPKETLLWLASVGRISRSSNKLALEKERKDAQDKLGKVVGKEITWLLTVESVSHEGIRINRFGHRALGTVEIRSDYLSTIPEYGRVHEAFKHRDSYLDHEGSEEWLLGLKDGGYCQGRRQDGDIGCALTCWSVSTNCQHGPTRTSRQTL
jgi:hypothetical protein